MNTNIKEPTSLTYIKGIGPVRASWLREIEICAISDLLLMTSEEIEHRLKLKKYTISQTDIEDWQQQARDMNIIDNPFPQKAVSNSIDKLPERQTFATFVVEFQKCSGKDDYQIETLVQHMEGGKLGGGKNNQWPGLANDNLIQWMKNQIDKKYLENEFSKPTKKNADVSESSSTKHPSGEPFNIIINRVQAYQPLNTFRLAGSGEPGQVFRGFLQGYQPFSLAVDLKFHFLENSSPNNQFSTFYIQNYFSNRRTGDTYKPEKIERNIQVSDKLQTTIALPEVTLPPGLYQLQTIVMLKTQPEVMGFLEIPLLQIT